MELSEELVECRQQLVDERRGGGRRYGAIIRERIRGYVMERRKSAASDWAIATELGLSWMTVRRWLGERKEAGSFLQVAVTAAPLAGATVVLHGPRGLRIEGADAVFVAQVLRALE